jgi:hypothetical protein
VATNRLRRSQRRVVSEQHAAAAESAQPAPDETPTQLRFCQGSAWLAHLDKSGVPNSMRWDVRVTAQTEVFIGPVIPAAGLVTVARTDARAIRPFLLGRPDGGVRRRSDNVLRSCLTDL